MSVSLIVLIVIVLLVVLLVIWGIGAYNGLVNLRNRVANGWAQIDVQLKQRADLVPNLVQTVKGYASHESSVLEEVTKARADVAQAQTAGGDQMQARADAEQRLGQSLVTLMARAEAYPELKANQNFLDLQRQLKDLEDKIAYARQFYNDVVQKFNTRIETVPSNIIASLFHFRQAQYFQADEGSRQAPVVDFGQ
ncbi:MULTISPECIES: LemA family protein [Bifidobacterium]|uniref:LemA family protein n=1 Tax=Bifidobacterium asteroides TaxID=1684 RepID=A0A0F4M1M7_9BIFI|nr:MULTISPECIES: LemA family protein [Bifidobacterium]KJY63736.1 LemA-like protein [Bifidobacterium asteroides]MBI0064130.1 LemA family protein [Bifidobacterium polysaccharolyticum]MBI0145937.1 LemA family protein [Bifidobacterium polysaccharolyticum]MBI0152595.1 LemA family protein [Bifidobacterium sp. M0399]MCP8615010.1 LemA family protein [Bifidobacterium asteroides]